MAPSRSQIDRQGPVSSISGPGPSVAGPSQNLRSLGARHGVEVAILPAALWLLVLLVNDGTGRPVLMILGTMGLLIVGAAFGWLWGPKTDAGSGWRTATLVAWVAFSAAILTALVVSVGATAQRLTDAGLAPERLRDAPAELLGFWFVLSIEPMPAIWLGALPVAWVWYRLMAGSPRSTAR